jgi:hypothetical protein
MDGEQVATVIRALLKRYGIQRNHSQQEYERGKQVIQDQGYSPALYYQAVAILARWVGV